MKTRLFTVSAFLVSIALLALLVPGVVRPLAAQSQPPSLVAPPLAPDRIRIADALRGSPVMFIENVGQFADGARFQVRSGMGAMWLAEDAIWITLAERSPADTLERFNTKFANVEREDELLRAVNLKLSFPGANPALRLEPFDRLDTVVNYFIGNDPDQWHPDVPVWGGVRYIDLYPGIDLELISTAGQWQQRIIARPGADLGAMGLRVEGTNTLAVDDAGHLHLSTAIGDFTMPLFQLVTAGNFPVPTLGEEPKVIDNDILFPFAVLTASTRPLSAISPADNPDDLLYSTFLGGSDADKGQAVAVDGSRAAYITGWTESSDFPTSPGAFDTTINNKDAFVTKLNAAGSALVYSTFLGGLSSDFGRGIAVDGAGSAYVTGKTDSTDFPTTPGAFDTTYNDRGDAFVLKLDASGSSLVYGTFLGGSENDDGRGIAVDGSGAAYVTGEVWSDDYPTTAGAFDTTFNGGNTDVFVTKLNAAGSALVYSTFLGGSGSSYEGRDAGIAVDASGAAYITGWTGSDDYPTTAGAFDTTFDGSLDAFVSKLNAVGSDLVYSTFLGGSDSDQGFAIAVDGSGEVYVTGRTRSTDYSTTAGAFDTNYNGGTYDAFVTKLNAASSGLVYSTFLGGDGDYESGWGIAVDGGGVAYITGGTESSNFPTTPDAFDTTLSDPTCPSYAVCPDVFVTKLNATGSGLVYSSFLGGGKDDVAEGIAVDQSGAAYLTGLTNSSSDFPTTPGAFDPTDNPGSEAFVAKFAVGGAGEIAEYKVFLPAVLKNR